MVWFVDNLVSLVSLFTQVATAHPLSALLVLSSLAIFVVALGTFGVLTVGGIFSAILPE